MKKSFFIVQKIFMVGVFLFLLFIPLATAVKIDMKMNFSQGETLIAKVSGNFYEAISKEDIIFKRGHVRTSIIPFIAEINNDFYIYAQLLDKIPGNYSITIENAKYIQGNKIIEEDISKNFSINGNPVDFSVNPGFITTDEDFFIEVRNLQDSEIKIDSKILNESSGNEGFFDSLFGGVKSESSITLKSGETKKINFDVEDFEKLSMIELSTENTKYEVLVYIFSKKEKEEEMKKVVFRFEPSELNISISTNSERSKIIYLLNTGKDVIENISLKVSDSLLPYVNFSVEEINKLKENSSEKIIVYFYSSEEGVVEGQITAVSGETFTYASVFLNFLKDYISIDGDEPKEESSSETCSELNGKMCSENQKCDGKIEYTTKEECCIGTCIEIEESSMGKIIGWAMVTLIFILLVWFYFKRYKKVKKISDLRKILKKF